MTITYMIPGVPLLNQLHESTSDGQPDENTRMNCVFASNAALATALLHRSFNGDELKDMDPKYGQGYTGGASEANLVDTMRKLGIQMTRVGSTTQQDLIDALHREIPQGHGCIITMPSQWNSAVEDAGASWNPRTYSGPSHVGLMCGVGPGMLRCMNPWGGFWHDGSDDYWSARLIDHEIWVGTLIAASENTTMGVPQNWKDDGKTLIAPNGVPVIKGFREHVLNYPGGWDALNYPLKPEQSVTSGSIEPGNANIGPGSRQDFRWVSLGWTTSRGVYHIWTGQDILALETQLAAAQTHVSQLAAQVAELQKQVDAASASNANAAKAVAALDQLAQALRAIAA